MKIGNIVHLKGQINGGAGKNVIATLPEGWRPAKYTRFCCTHGTHKDSIQIYIYANGNIINNSSSFNAYISFDGISFPVNL